VRRRNRRGQGERLREDLISGALEIVELHGLEALSLRSVARHVGIAATSVYLHFPDLDHLVAAVVERGFHALGATTDELASPVSDPAEQLRARCRAYCRFALDHPNLYQAMFQADLPRATITGDPSATPGRRAFDRLVAAVERCLDSGLAADHEDPFRLASLIWTAEHGIASTRISRPSFPWAPLDALVNEMVNRLMGFRNGS
jgi:AcrR family transcriptional regulator